MPYVATMSALPSVTTGHQKGGDEPSSPIASGETCVGEARQTHLRD